MAPSQELHCDVTDQAAIEEEGRIFAAYQVEDGEEITYVMGSYFDSQPF